jgi:hypothetical protein
MMAMVGGKDKTKIRNTTPDEFRDLLLSMVRGACSRCEGSDWCASRGRCDKTSSLLSSHQSATQEIRNDQG